MLKLMGKKIVTFLIEKFCLSKPVLHYNMFLFDLFDLNLYVPSTIFQLKRDAPSWVEPVLS